MMRISGTFLDEISHDIPHQNWGEKEWDSDFRSMKETGIDTVILIRCGCARFLTYPSRVLMDRESAHRPPIDLVDLFLELSERYGMKFYFGLYDSRRYWHEGDHRTEIELNRHVIDEVWADYGTRKAFAGWYISQEACRNAPGMIQIYRELGGHCKALSGDLPTMISPYIDGRKNVSADAAALAKTDIVDLGKHAREWDEILSGIEGVVDIVAFQDGHVDYHELEEFLIANRELTQRHGMQSWTNVECFDRDMPIKFLPIKWEKMALKLEAARRAGLDKAITFEYSHFMSPNSCYPSAHHLHARYMEALAAAGSQ